MQRRSRTRASRSPGRRTLTSRSLRLTLCLWVLSPAVGTRAQTTDILRTAEADLQHGKADQAIAGLHAAVSNDPTNGPAHLLLCRAYLSKLHGTEAAAECRRALKAGLDSNSTAQDWAGRAFGAEAQHAGPISGLKLAGQVRTAFQTAYTLNRRNPAAANDLGEYFVNAPFLVGGGSDKATALAEELEPTLPETAHRLRALLAEKNGDKSLAEHEFTASAHVAQSAGAYVDLACFYARESATDQATSTGGRAIALDRALDANVVDAAGCLNDVHQTSLAMQTLRAYLDHGQQSDSAPAFRVHTMLGEILAAQGDKSAARREFQAALALAGDYAPARKGMDSL